MNEQLKTLIGQSLDGFTIQEYVEIFQVDLDDRRVKSHGCLKDEALAKAFVQVTGELPYWHPADKEFLRTEKVLVLTDGNRAFRITSVTGVQLLQENETRARFQKQAREQISPAVRELLAV